MTIEQWPGQGHVLCYWGREEWALKGRCLSLERKTLRETSDAGHDSVYVCVCVYFHAWMYSVHVCAKVRSRRIAGVLLDQYPPYSLKRAAHCTWGSLTAELAGHLGYKCMLPCLDIYMRAGDQNLGPHTCPASALPAKPSPSPLVVFYIVTYFIHSVLTTAIICLQTSNTFHI